MATFEPIPNQPGLNHVPSNPFRLLDFQFLKLAGGETCQGFTGPREVLVVLLGGRASITAGGATFPSVGGRPNVFSGKPHSVYLPCGTEYTVTALGPLEAALVSAPSELQASPYLIGPEKVAAGVWGAANFSRSYHQILTLASQADLPAQRLIVGETYTPSGNWSTYPPHKHEQDDLPREAWHGTRRRYALSIG
jgi:5-deoxy-glucuronate isomerase